MDKLIKQIDFPIIESSYTRGKFDTFHVQTCTVTFSTIGRNSFGHARFIINFHHGCNKTFSLFKRVKSIIIFFSFFCHRITRFQNSEITSPSFPVKRNTKISYLREDWIYQTGYNQTVLSIERIGFNRPCSDIILWQITRSYSVILSDRLVRGLSIEKNENEEEQGRLKKRWDGNE